MDTRTRYGGSRSGSVLVLVVVALVALVGVTAFSMDVGRTILAAQRAQNVADAAAVAAVCNAVNAVPATTMARIGDTISANNSVGGSAVTWSSGEVTLYSSGQYVAGYGTLAAYEEGVRVVTHVPVTYYFATMLGINGTTATRPATAVRIFALGSPICPIWISWETDYQYGVQQELLMADGPHYANIPGNFGFLSPATGSNDFLTMLRGYQVPAAMILGNYVEVGNEVYAYTGVSTGQWVAALDSSNDGLARLQRATWAPWTTDTFDVYLKDNPRIMIIPMVQYLDGTGSNARFLIKKFGAFWLEAVGKKSIIGRFIRYQTPGGSEDPLAGNTGLWQAKLVK